MIAQAAGARDRSGLLTPTLRHVAEPRCALCEEQTVAGLAFEYPGLEIMFIRQKGETQFRVWRFHVSGGGYPLVNGLGVGSRRKAVIRKLWPPTSTSVNGDNGHEVLNYALTRCDDWVTLEIGEGRVVLIKSDRSCFGQRQRPYGG